MKAPLSELFDTYPHGALLRMNRSYPVRQIEDEARKRGYSFFHIEGNKIERKDEFLHHAALALQFPNYFGDNWDAFEDSLTDLSWLEDAKGYVIYFDRFDTLLQHARGEFDTLSAIMYDAIEYWHSQGKPMYMLLRSQGNARALSKAADFDLPSW